MPQRDVYNPLLFEIAWEVANKVGGIYTVIKTKVPVTVHEFGDRYCLIGPLSAGAPMEVESLEPPAGHIRDTLEMMAGQGVRYLFGRWLVEGAPYVLLFDTASVTHKLDEWKGDLWRAAGIPSPEHDFEMNNSILFGYLVAWFLGDLAPKFSADPEASSSAMVRSPTVIAHFHEWQAGVAIPLCKSRRIDVTTIFTTHATLLGRYLCAGSVDFYNNLRNFNVDKEAGDRGIYHRYCVERASAHCADVFTTVSHITAYESEHLLKRKPDGVLPNGLNVVKFSAVHEFQNKHALNKEKIHDFVRGHFYGHYDFDLENTVYFFTAGRYEFRNKGVDMLLESLAPARSNITVVTFLVMPAPTHSFNVEALKGQAVTKQLRETVNDVQDRIGREIYERALRGEELDPKDWLSDEDKVLLKRRMFALKRSALPPIVTHNMVDDNQDSVIDNLRRLQLYNKPEDRVKIIFHPEFLNANNPLLGLDYEDFVRGCHLGVFPSYYEPWGYTPAECTVMGVPSVTTNLSGFGCFMDENIENCEDYGIYIVDRRLKSIEESIQQLCDFMFRFCQKTRRQRINQRNRTERLSDLLDWKRMGLEYMKARQLALRRVYPDSFLDDDEDEEDIMPIPMKIPKPLSAPASPRLRRQLNGYFDQNEEDEDEDRAPIRLKEFPALRRNADASREEELLQEGDIATLNNLTLEDKKQRQH
ncbi:glycogen synthase [Lichtheimia corymbifera JMRC:FSU:9682]|uniref:Glycogen [starch] synthase n=1 Tax=Lichtheimia corymbifera JMRC:FSU:9682 TaxID=1263082 RepID=A0A068RPX1_9FUNG|nr:glycogen synthase [Lichtheimia corymbifera JMRC:FSU:9682]